MKSKSLVCLSLIFLFSLHIFSCKKAKQEEEKATEIRKAVFHSEISGRITDEYHKGIPGVRLYFYRFPSEEPRGTVKKAPSTITDKDGSYTMKDLEPGQYSIVIETDNFVPPKPKSVTLEADQVLKNIDFILTSTGGIILGKVVDKASNEPLKQYFIHILDTKEEPDAARVIRYNFDPEKELVESEDGCFWYARLASGTYKLIAYANGYAINILDNIPVEKGERTSGITIELKKGATLTGIVRSEESGAPIKEAEIYQILEIKEAGVEEVAEENIFITKTDEKGEFKITGINSGEYILAVNHNDFITQQFEVGIYLEETSQNIEIYLVPKSSSAK